MPNQHLETNPPMLYTLFPRVLINVRSPGYRANGPYAQHPLASLILYSSQGFVCRIIVPNQILVCYIREIFASINSRVHAVTACAFWCCLQVGKTTKKNHSHHTQSLSTILLPSELPIRKEDSNFILRAIIGRFGTKPDLVRSTLSKLHQPSRNPPAIIPPI